LVAADYQENRGCGNRLAAGSAARIGGDARGGAMHRQSAALRADRLTFHRSMAYEPRVLGRLGRAGNRCHFPTFGQSHTAFQEHQDSPMKVRNSLKSLRSRHRDNRLVRRKGRVYVINKVQRRFKARQG